MSGSIIFPYSNTSSLLMANQYSWEKAEETVYLRRQTAHACLPIWWAVSSKAWIFAISEVFYFLEHGLWPNWQQSLCNLVFVFHAEEHKLSSLISVVCFVITTKLFQSQCLKIRTKAYAVFLTSDWQLQLL